MSETPASPMLATGEPTPVVGLTFGSFAECFDHSASWLSKSQVFISTDAILPIGSPVAVDVSVVDGTPLVRAFGRVSWVRKQRMRDDQPPGIGIGIIHLDAASAALIDAVDRCRQNTAAAEPAHAQVPIAEPGVVEADLAADVDADVALAVDSIEATHPEPPASGVASDHSIDREPGNMVVTASAMFTDGLHFGEDGAPGSHPAISTGHELDEFAEISFSDVENAVSREIDAAVLRHKPEVDPSPSLAAEVIADDDALSAHAQVGTGDDAYPAEVGDGIAAYADQAFDPDAEDLEDDFDEESEILAPLELALVEVNRTPPSTGLKAEAAAVVLADETGEPNTDPTHDIPAIAETDHEPVSRSISTAIISAADLAAAARPAEGTIESPSAEPASETAAVTLKSASDLADAVDTHDTAPVETVHDEAPSDSIDAQAFRDGDDTLSDPSADADAESDTAPVATSEDQDQTLAAHLLAASAPAEEETADTQPTAVPNEEALSPENGDLEDGGLEGRSAEDGDVEDPSLATEEAAEAESPQPGYDPWDLDVSSFIDDALRERAANARAAKPPAAWVSAPEPSPMATTSTEAADDHDDTGVHRSEDSTITVMPKTAKEDDDTLDFGPPRTPVPPAQDAPAVLDVQSASAAPPEAPTVAAMDQEPDFGTMAAELKVPSVTETVPIPLITEDTSRINLPADALCTAVAAAEVFSAEAEIPEPSAFEETAELPSVPKPATAPSRPTAPKAMVPPPEGAPSTAGPRAGYYARAGARSRRRRSTGLGLLAAVFCVAALGLALVRTGTFDKLSSWAHDTFQATPTEQTADLSPSAGGPTSTSTTATAGTRSSGVPKETPKEASEGTQEEAPADGLTVAATTETPMPPTESQPVDPGNAGETVADAPSTTPAGIDTPPSRPVDTLATQDPQTARRAVRAMVEGWAAAWSRQNPDAYLTFYDTTFETPDGLERSIWDDQRRSRLRAPRSLTVQASELEVEALDGNQATVRFFQSYRAISAAGRRNLGTWKRFELVRRANGWRIVRESLVR